MNARDARNDADGDAWDRAGTKGISGGFDLAISDAAAALGISQQQLRHAIANGYLAAEPSGKTYRIRLEELTRYARMCDLPLPSRPLQPLQPQARVVALPSPEPAVTRLLSADSLLVGREADLERLNSLLGDPAVRLITLVGPGGIGKTRLALAAAEFAQARYTHGALVVDLSAVRKVEDAVPSIAQTLGLRERSDQDRLSQIVGYLQARNMLVVLDNLEQILGVAPDIAWIIERAPEITFLVTSRSPLGLRGEREVPVPPLELASADATPKALQSSAAGRLFIERVRLHDPAFAVDAQSAPIVAEICARLDGLPLAIELAAARARTLSPRQLRDRLDRVLPLLTRGHRNAPARHLTMRDAIAWSYDLLKVDECRLFRQLAICVGGFTLDAAEAIGGCDDPPDGDRPDGWDERTASPAVVDLLEALLEQSLVAREVGLDGEPRFRMLETIREFGLEQLTSAEETATRAAHAAYFGALVQAMRPMVVTEAAREPMERLAADEPNLHAALAWLDDHGPVPDFVAMVAGCCHYWMAHTLLHEGGRWVDRALRKRAEASPADQLRLILGAAILLIFRGEAAQAKAAFAESLSLGRSASEPFDRAITLLYCGAAASYQGDLNRAETLLAEAQAEALSIADTRLSAAILGGALANLSVVARAQGEISLATARSEEALLCYRGHGLDLAETRTLMDLAAVAWDKGDYPQVVERYQACLARTGERGDMRLVVTALTGIASAATAWAQPRTALLLYAAADALRTRLGLSLAISSDATAIERDLGALREALGADDFASAWAEGSALPLSEVLALAAGVTPEASESTGQSPASSSPLTRRELEILRYVAAGQSDREIADTLFIGPRTVSWHVSSILDKLEATTRLKAVATARAAGLI